MDSDAKYVINTCKKIVIFSGIFFNSLTILVQSRGSLKGTWLSVYFRVLATNYLINNVLFALDSVNSPFSKTFLVESIVCKLSEQFNYAFCATASWILAFISIDRYVTISFLRKPKCFKKIYFNLLLFTFIIGWNLAYYSPYFIFSESFMTFSRYNTDNFTIEILPNAKYIENLTECSIIGYDTSAILAYLDLVNSTLVPFLVMLVFAVLIILKIDDSKKKIYSKSLLKKKNETRAKLMKKRMRKNIKFSITILILNSIFLAFNLPVSINLIIPYLSIDYSYTFFQAYYSIDFFVYLCTNSGFRHEFLVMLSLQKRNYCLSQ